MKKVLITPNTLTMSRIVMTFFFIVLMMAHGFFFKLVGAFMFFLASFTDLYDGYIARKYNLISDFGKVMDPIADKFLMLSAFLIFVKMGIISVFVFLLIFGREIFITWMRFYAKGKGFVLAAEQFGKYKTVTQFVTVGFILIFIVLRSASFSQDWSDVTLSRWNYTIDFFVFITVLMTLASGVSYYMNNKDVFKNHDK
ncbi:MAG: CDP-diacylglycerol--glycerol-3-phosphate 3-phosphatidyltransferase [Candidatus Omnitrophica bacterium]|nr:CDP-diacylglycerol--glycerol-3-phosphate 3-phosphatidyltransferase [Candidatus Omnitrophota bacterium]